LAGILKNDGWLVPFGSGKMPDHFFPIAAAGFSF
jgi:hypothetical protein